MRSLANIQNTAMVLMLDDNESWKDLYSPAYPMDMLNYSRYQGVADATVDEINKHYLTVGINMCQLLRWTQSTLCK